MVLFEHSMVQLIVFLSSGRQCLSCLPQALILISSQCLNFVYMIDTSLIELRNFNATRTIIFTTFEPRVELWYQLPCSFSYCDQLAEETGAGCFAFLWCVACGLCHSLFALPMVPSVGHVL